MNSILETFFIEDSQGKCDDYIWEFGNLHRKDFTCAFYVDGECHYNGNCDRLERKNDEEIPL